MATISIRGDGGLHIFPYSESKGVARPLVPRFVPRFICLMMSGRSTRSIESVLAVAAETTQEGGMEADDCDGDTSSVFRITHPARDERRGACGDSML